jgi:NADH-quinone oxidoreductase subunit E
MNTFAVPPALEAEIDELITHYPQKRSASLMLLHALQEHFGWLPREAVEWTAAKLGLQPINVQELVTFYPMFRQAQAGRHQFKVCRTLSCALGGGQDLHRHLCQKFGLDPSKHGIQTTPDGRYSVEFVECLASCGTAPVMMVNEELHQSVTPPRADQIVGACGGHGAGGSR